MTPVNKWRLLKRIKVFDSKFVKVYQDKVKLPSGKIIDDFTLVKKHDVVIIVATDKLGKVLVIREYRHGVDSFEFSLPAGLMETNEQLITTARRELYEETGYGGGNFKYVGELHDDPTTDIRKIHVVRAESVYRKGKQKLEDSETIIEVRSLAIEELKKQIKKKQWHSSTSLSALVISGYFL